MGQAGAGHSKRMMRAIVQEGYGSADVLRLREIDVPVHAADGVLVSVRAASVNAADSHLVHMPFPARVVFGFAMPKMPIRGTDVAGVVEAVGANVTRFKPGDEVFGVARGSFAEFAGTTEDRLVPKPGRLTFGQAAAVPLAGITALQGLRDKAAVRPGQRVLIHGAGGGVGTFAVQIAKALGAHVTAVTSTRNLDLVRSTSPDELIDYTQEDFTRRGERYDVFFDVAANRSLLECHRVLTPNGVFVLAGAAKGGMGAIVWRLLSMSALSRFVKQRMFTFMARTNHDDLVALAALIESGQVSPVIDCEYSLSKVPEAVRYLKSGQARAKVVINVG